jgi:hypothetical protein
MSSEAAPAPDDPEELLGMISDLMQQIDRLKAEREVVARALFGDGWDCCSNLGPCAQSIAAQAHIAGLIDFLRDEEGDSVTVLCDNPEGPPNNAVVCNGRWTEWKDKRFKGDTLADALSAAWLECMQVRAAIAAGTKWWSSTNKCPACDRMFTDGETCSRGGCPMGGDF